MKYRTAILIFGVCLLPINAMAERVSGGITTGIHPGGCPEGRPCPEPTKSTTIGHAANQTIINGGNITNGDSQTVIINSNTANGNIRIDDEDMEPKVGAALR